MRARTIVALLSLSTAFLASTGRAPAQDDDLDEQAPGLLARFSVSSNLDDVPRASRIAPDLNADWGSGTPDPRVPAVVPVRLRHVFTPR